MIYREPRSDHRNTFFQQILFICVLIIGTGCGGSTRGTQTGEVIRTIRGTLVDALGETVAGVDVTVLNAEPSAGDPRPILTDTTSESGNFVLDNAVFVDGGSQIELLFESSGSSEGFSQISLIENVPAGTELVELRVLLDDGQISITQVSFDGSMRDLSATNSDPVQTTSSTDAAEPSNSSAGGSGATGGGDSSGGGGSDPKPGPDPSDDDTPNDDAPDTGSNESTDEGSMAADDEADDDDDPLPAGDPAPEPDTGQVGAEDDPMTGPSDFGTGNTEDEDPLEGASVGTVIDIGNGLVDDGLLPPESAGPDPSVLPQDDRPEPQDPTGGIIGAPPGVDLDGSGPTSSFGDEEELEDDEGDFDGGTFDPAGGFA